MYRYPLFGMIDIMISVYHDIYHDKRKKRILRYGMVKFCVAEN